MAYKIGTISSSKKLKLDALMKKANLKEFDIKEHFIRSKGPGGQNVNKTSTCVYLKHLPSKLEVKCQKYRSQALNRFFARYLLAEKINLKILKEKSEKQKNIRKLKLINRKRSIAAKERILKEKRLRSEKKRLRRPPD